MTSMSDRTAAASRPAIDAPAPSRGRRFRRLVLEFLPAYVISLLILPFVISGGRPWPWTPQTTDLQVYLYAVRAMLHGANGLRTVINDYAERDNTRFWLKMLLYTATVFTVLLGTLVIFTFDPNIR